MTPYLLTKTEKIPHATICGEGYADSLFGRKRVNFGALHAQGNTVTSATYADLLKNLSASCHQVQTTWTSEYRCFVAT